MEDLLKKPLKILIGIPCYHGSMLVETIGAIINLVRYHSLKYPHHQLGFEVRVRNFMTYAAEKITEKAVSEGWDYLFYMGDDVLPPYDCLERLLKHDKDMVACAVFARSEPYAFYAWDKEMKRLRLSDLKTGLRPVGGTGTGVTLFKTKPFTDLKRPWWRWPNDDSTDCDKEFCERARREIGLQIYVDTDIEIGHLDYSPQTITSDTHKSWVDNLKKSGVLEQADVKNHKDFGLLKEMLNGA